MVRAVISVVVPTRDRSERLDALLQSLSAQTLPPGDFEAIVVDDGSRDGTPQMLAEAAERHPYRLTIVSGEGRGPAAARNLGWQAAAGDIVAFTDDDCEAGPGWLEAIAASALETPDAVIQGRTTPIPRERERLGLLARTKVIESEGPWYQTCNI